MHACKGLPHVIDVRNYGLIGGHRARADRRHAGRARLRASTCKCFEHGLLMRTTGDIIALSPPLIIEKTHIDELFGILSEALKE